MSTPPSGQPHVEPNIFVQRTRLVVVDSFVYLGSILSWDGSINSEINLRIEKASKVFEKRENRVWSYRDLTKTNLSDHELSILSSFLYTPKTQEDPKQ